MAARVDSPSLIVLVVVLVLVLVLDFFLGPTNTAAYNSPPGEGSGERPQAFFCLINCEVLFTYGTVNDGPPPIHSPRADAPPFGLRDELRKS
jgi:hypothetical protein